MAADVFLATTTVAPPGAPRKCFRTGEAGRPKDDSIPSSFVVTVMTAMTDTIASVGCVSPLAVAAVIMEKMPSSGAFFHKTIRAGFTGDFP